MWLFNSVPQFQFGGLLTSTGRDTGSHTASHRLPPAPPALDFGSSMILILLWSRVSVSPSWLLSDVASCGLLPKLCHTSDAQTPLLPSIREYGGITVSPLSPECAPSLSVPPLIEARVPRCAGCMQPSTCTFGGAQADHAALHRPASGGQAPEKGRSA